MARQFLNSIDLNNTQLLNALAQVLATDPANLAGKLYYHSGTGTLRFMDGTNIRVLGRLDQISAPTAPVSFNGQRATSLADATAGTDGTTLQQVQALINAVTSGMDWKDGGARVASTGNVSVAAPGTAIDGVTLANGNRVLLKDQTAAAENGLYVFNGSATPMTRTTDADTAAEVLGMVVAVQEGSVNSDSGWLLTTNDPITLGTTALAFTRIFGGAATSGPRKFSLTYGGAASQAVTHNLGTTDVQIQVRDATSNAVVEPDMTVTDANTVTLLEATAPAANSRRVVVIG